MRLAYVTDVHECFDTVPRALATLGRIDAIVIGGDISSRGSANGVGGAIEGWRSLAPELLAVAGNWDSAEINACLNELGVGVDGRGVTLGSVGVCGVSGSPVSSIDAPYELEEDEIGHRLETGFAAIENCSVRIVCSHTPPLGTSCDRIYSGAHIGSSAVRSFVEERQPELVLCGHVHEARGFDEIGRTKVVNPGPVRDGHYALVEIDGERLVLSLDPE